MRARASERGQAPLRNCGRREDESRLEKRKRRLPPTFTGYKIPPSLHYGVHVRSIAIRRALFGAAVVAVLTGAAPLAAHDVWMEPGGFQTPSAAPQVTAGRTDSTSAVAAVAAFRTALAKGDSLGALALLAPDVTIMEAGEIELLPEYRRHHLSADVAFARAIPGVHTLRSVVVLGDAAWVGSTTVTEGQLNGRTINSAGAELIVLSRQGPGAPWTIRAVHWSSRQRGR